MIVTEVARLSPREVIEEVLRGRKIATAEFVSAEILQCLDFHGYGIVEENYSSGQCNNCEQDEGA